VELFTFIVALILVVLPVVDWTASIILYRASAKVNHTNIALKERGQMAGVLATASTLGGVLALFRLFELHPPNIIALFILSGALILSSVPNLYWLSLYFGNRLRK